MQPLVYRKHLKSSCNFKGDDYIFIHDPVTIGKKLLEYRKKAGLTQSEVAEAAGLSDRTYADIERGKSNMRILTALSICDVLNITPNDFLLTEDNEQKTVLDSYLILKKLATCSNNERQTAFELLNCYISSLNDKKSSIRHVRPLEN